MSSHTVSMSAAAKITSRTVKTTIVATSALCVCTPDLAGSSEAEQVGFASAATVGGAAKLCVEGGGRVCPPPPKPTTTGGRGEATLVDEAWGVIGSNYVDRHEYGSEAWGELRSRAERRVGASAAGPATIIRAILAEVGHPHNDHLSQAEADEFTRETRGAEAEESAEPTVR